MIPLWKYPQNYADRPHWHNLVTAIYKLLQCWSVLWVFAEEVILLSLPLFKPPTPIMNPVTLLTLRFASIKTTNPIMQSSQSTHNTQCRYSNHQPPSRIQALYSHYPLKLFKSPTPIMNPVTLITLHIVAIQSNKPHHAVQAIYS
jgi:hypothetical protein